MQFEEGGMEVDEESSYELLMIASVRARAEIGSSRGCSPKALVGRDRQERLDDPNT